MEKLQSENISPYMANCSFFHISSMIFDVKLKLAVNWVYIVAHDFKYSTVNWKIWFLGIS